jgi:hypothetical protein
MAVLPQDDSEAARDMAAQRHTTCWRRHEPYLSRAQDRQHAERMPKSPSGGIGHVPVAVYSCAAESAAVREAERRARHYADARHWHVAGTWSDDDPSTPLDARPAWAAVTSALSSGLIRGIVVAGITHLAEDAGQFAALGVLIRDRGGFLTEAASPPARQTPAQHERRRILLEASSGWWLWGDLVPGAAS